MGKNYILDTSVILDNPQINLSKLSEGGKNKLYITEVILSELDKHKLSLKEDIKWAARTFFRSIKKSRFKKVKKNINGLKIIDSDNLFKVKLSFEEEEIEIFIIVRNEYSVDIMKHNSINDSKIIQVARTYKLDCVTNDIAFKAIAMSYGLKADNLYWDGIENPEKITFLSEFNIEESLKEKKINEILSSSKKWSQLILRYENFNNGELYSTGIEEYFIANGNSLERQNFDKDRFSKYDIEPINLEQKFYMSLLESDCKIIVVSGSTGSGKTLMAIQAGMAKVKDKNSPIDGIVYMRYTVNAEDKFSALGYRKGDEDTKLGYFNYPLYGSLNFIAESQMKKAGENKAAINSSRKTEITESIIKDYNIEVIDIAHARGVTISNKFIIFDEVQNTPNKILQLIGTRIGKDSQIVFMGDYNQVDHPYLSRERNGLITLLSLAKNDNMICGVKLNTTVRSEVAEWFQGNIIA